MAGTKDDDDDRDDEHAGENEIPVRETNEATEAPEEFEVNDEDEPHSRADDDLDEDLDDDGDHDQDDDQDDDEDIE